jgi:hypothetical protein
LRLFFSGGVAFILLLRPAVSALGYLIARRRGIRFTSRCVHRPGSPARGSGAWRPLPQGREWPPCCSDPARGTLEEVGIEPVRLGPPMLARDGDARWMNDMASMPRARSHRASQNPSQPASKATPVRVIYAPIGLKTEKRFLPLGLGLTREHHSATGEEEER